MTQPLLNRRRAILAAASLAVPSIALARPRDEPFRFSGWRGQQTDAERGFIEVPEDRRDPGSRLIRLGYVRFASTAARPAPPIIYLAGGPGGAATGAAAGPRFPIFMALREVADVIAFDQRGTGLSSHIPPRPPSAGPLPPATRAGLTDHVRKEVQSAWSDWTSAGVAMRGYNTVESADDVEALRRHLGAEKINLWAISYGSHLALAILKQYGDRIDRVALASLEGQDQTVKRPARLDAYMQRVDALLDAAPPVRSAVPDLPALMRRVHARLEERPVGLSVALGGSTARLEIGGFAVQLLASGMIANPQTLAMIPGLYLALDAGHHDVLTPLMGGLTGLLRVTGMPEAMDMASGISPQRLALVEEEARTSVFGDALNFPMPHLRGLIPGVDLGDAFREPIRIDAPALLIAGTLDGRTPLEEQAEVAAQFHQKSQIIVENAGHNVLEAHPEIQNLLVRFFSGSPVADARLSLPPPAFQIM